MEPEDAIEPLHRKHKHLYNFVEEKKELGKLTEIVYERDNKYIPNSALEEGVNGFIKMVGKNEKYNGWDVFCIAHVARAIRDGAEMRLGNIANSDKRISLREIVDDYERKLEQIDEGTKGFFGYSDDGSANIT